MNDILGRIVQAQLRQSFGDDARRGALSGKAQGGADLGAACRRLKELVDEISSLY